MNIQEVYQWSAGRKHVHGFYVIDDKGCKLFPATGYTSKAACQQFVDERVDPRAKEKAVLASWIEFNILREVSDLETVDPNHHLVRAIRAACDNHVPVDPRQARLF